VRVAIIILSLALAGPALALDFERGDCNFDTAVDIGDPIYLLGYLFSSGTGPACSDACDANDDGALDVADAIAMLAYLFDPAFPTLPAPFPAPGADPTPDALTCGPPVADADGDGFAIGDGDCCDTDPLVNPGAFDIAGNGIDEDCSGTPDDEPAGCDTLLSGLTPLELATSLGICQTAGSGTEWGLIAATLERANGAPYPGGVQARVVQSFGAISPEAGSSFVALSTGFAGPPSTPGYVPPVPGTDYGVAGLPPADYLAAHGGSLPNVTSCLGVCPSGSGANDSVSLHLTIRVPTNATALSFRWFFLSSEYQAYVCTQYNDFALALLDSTAAGIPADKNIMFDVMGNAVTVSSAFLSVCIPQSCYTCPLGTGLLAGTGFSPFGGGTGWVTTTAPVVPGETIDLRLMVWDTSDGIYDTVFMIDAFEWGVEAPLAPCP
jgi:hypothetical protein